MYDPCETFADYADLAVRTRRNVHPDHPNWNDSPLQLATMVLGLVAEAGEVGDLVKKHLGHSQELNMDEVKAELGDVLWYVTNVAELLGLDLQGVAEANIKKLGARHPEGIFSPEYHAKGAQG